MILIASRYLFDGLLCFWIQDSRFSCHFDEATCPHMEPDVAPIVLQVQGSSCTNFFKFQNHHPTSYCIIINQIFASYNVNDANMTI